MKKIFILTVMLLMILFTAVQSKALEYEFYPDDNEFVAENEIERLYEGLPEEIKDKLEPISENNGEKISKKYSFGFFFDILKEAFLSALPPYTKMLFVSVGTLLIICVIRHMHNSLDSAEISPAVNMCTSLVSALVIGNMQRSILSTASGLLSLLSDTMLLIVPVMEAIYLSSGNFTLAAVTSTGINLMIAFTQNIFAKVLMPAVAISFLLAVIACVTGNRGIVFLSKSLRTVITTMIIIIMTLMTFALTLQSSAAAAVDNFTMRTIRFALGSYIPIVGGAVSETFSLIQGSFAIIKNLSGITCIVILILVCAPPLIAIVVARFSVYI
jgi:stage III sporulation protein AE